MDIIEQKAPMPKNYFLLSRLTNALYAFTLTILLVLAIASYQSFQSLQRKNEWVTHTHQVLLTSQHLLASLSDAESGVRGYAIAKDSAYLASYRVSRNALTRQAQQL